MALTKQRPVHLDLRKIRMPGVAIMSIGHRISGVLLFLAIPILIYLLQVSLDGPAGFARAGELVNSGLFKLILIGLVWALTHHFFAGIRYLLIDIDVGIELTQARLTAKIVMALGALGAAFAIVGVLL
jgi:succinate dehydrogenase / fumarate reductase cytochrome b subunit